MLANGTYKGFSPTDESPAGVGEMELVLDGDQAVIRVAMGFEIVEYGPYPRSGFRTLTDAEVLGRLDLSDHDGPVAYEAVCLDGGELVLLYLDAAGTSAIAVHGLPCEEIFGYSILFAPAEASAQRFEEGLFKVEAEFGCPGGIPRLATGGEAPAGRE